jgi:MFS family permease
LKGYGVKILKFRHKTTKELGVLIMFSLTHQSFYFARALKSRPYKMLWIGQAISNLGDGVFSIALAWQVLLMTHSPAAVGIVLLASSLPRIAFVLLGGVATDRLPRRAIILWSDGGRGVIVMSITILGFTGHLQLWHVIGEALIFGIVRGFFGPALIAITPDLVKQDDLASANALSSISSSATQLIGPLLGGLLIPLITPMGVFAINALSFFISTLLLFPVRISESHIASRTDRKDVATSEEGNVSKRGGFRRVMTDLGEGLGYIRGSRWLWVGLFFSSLGNMGSALPSIALPFLVSRVYAQGPWLLGLMSTGGAVGSLLALLSIGQVKKIQRRGLKAYLSLILSSLGLVMLGLPFPNALAFIAAATLAVVMGGFGSAYFNTIWFILIQEMVPREKLGRVSSVDTLGSVGLMPIALGLGGLLTDVMGPAMICMLSGFFCLITTVIPLCVRDIRTME